MQAITRHTLKPRVKRVEFDAEDLYECAGSPTKTGATGGGVSPSWQMNDAARRSVSADLMVPFDWRPGTDIKFYLEYAPTAVGGIGNVALGIDYVLYEDVITQSLGLNPARTIRLTTDRPPFGVVMKRTDNPVAIPGLDLVGKRQIQIAFSRFADIAALDTDNRNIYLFKVIMEYESYEP